ncbi:hypothetical protein CRUP_022773, partial [Coryphaenoides rupestris]
LSNVTVYWEAEPSAAGAELLSSSGSVSFGVGQRRESFFVRVAQDQVPELDQHFNVTLVNVSHGRLGNERTIATLTVLASDDPYGVFVFAATARALRVPEADATVRVTYETLGEAEPAPYRTPGVGRASEGRDFVPLLGSVVFLPNQSEANISLQILQDEDPERDESVFVELTAVEVLETAQDRPSETINTFSQRAEAVAQVVVNASDDAFGTLQLSVSAVSVAEDYVGPIINVTRTGGIFADVSVKFRAVPITATVMAVMGTARNLTETSAKMPPSSATLTADTDSCSVPNASSLAFTTTWATASALGPSRGETSTAVSSTNTDSSLSGSSSCRIWRLMFASL